MIEYQIVELNKEIKTSFFNCGDNDLNEFLREDALRNQDDWLSRTMVMEINRHTIGYFTITPDTLHKGRISVNDKLPGYPYLKYPAIKLARLAVDKKYQHNGYGKLLMLEFFNIARNGVDIEGGRFITVDAKKSATGFYERFGFKAVQTKLNDEIIPMYMDFKSYYQISASKIKLS